MSGSAKNVLARLGRRPDARPTEEADEQPKPLQSAPTPAAEPAPDRPALPVVGVIYRRDRHPGAKCLDDLLERGDRHSCNEALPLDELLERTWEQDAHFITYRIDADELPLDDPEHEHAYARANKCSPFVTQLEKAGGRIRVPFVALDFDNPKAADGSKTPWEEETLAEHVATVEAAIEAELIPSPTAFYDTAHGSRFIFALTREVGHLDAEELIRGLMVLFETAGLPLDEQCDDWTRLFRSARTKREDTGELYEPKHLRVDGTLLDPDTIERVEATNGQEHMAEVEPYHGDMPEAEEVRELLERTGKSGKPLETELVKVARRALHGRDAGAVCFGNRPLAVGEERWNRQVLEIVGSAVSMLAREEVATPEGVYALLHPAIEQLQVREDQGMQATDWYAKTWSMVARMWSQEEAKIQAEHQERELRIADGKEHAAHLLEQHRRARPDDVPGDADEAREWFKRQGIASDGHQHHYVRRRDGTYNYRSVTDAMLIPMIRELGVDDMIPTEEWVGKSLRQRSPRAILNDHATPVLDIECTALEEHAYIDGEPGYKTLRIPIHQLSHKLTPGGRFDEGVNEWLHELFGDRYEDGVEWISHALDVRRAICALNLYGEHGTGKGMFAAGLSECFRGEHLNDGRALGKWNLGLIKGPIVNCDEGVPPLVSDEALPLDQAFRSLVTGGKLTIRAMRMDPFTAVVYPRIIFSSNDENVALEALSGQRKLTPQDIEALELRLLSIEVGSGARELLTKHGNYSWTSGWITGNEPSRYVLANHFYHLYCNRQPSRSGSGRLLVEGDIGTLKHGHYRKSKAHAQGVRDLVREVARAQDKKVHAFSSKQRAVVHLDGPRMFVTASMFEPNYCGRLDRLDRPEGIAIVELLERSGVLGPVKNTRKGGVGARWREVDLRALREYAGHLEDLDVSDLLTIDRRLGEEG